MSQPQENSANICGIQKWFLITMAFLFLITNIINTRRIPVRIWNWSQQFFNAEHLCKRIRQKKAGFAYLYLGEDRKYKNFSSLATVKFSPNNKNVMTPYGKYTFDQNFPEVYLNYEQAYKTFGGELNYSRFDMLFRRQFQSVLGATGTRLYGGYYHGKAPIWHLWYGWFQILVKTQAFYQILI